MIGQPYRLLVVVTLGAIVWSACGQDAPARSTGAQPETAPAPAPTSSTQALEQIGRPKEAAAAYRILLQKAGPDDSALAQQARQRLAAIEKSSED